MADQSRPTRRQYKQLPSVRILRIRCPLGCALPEKTAKAYFPTEVSRLKTHIADEHGDLIESQLDTLVLEERYSLFCNADWVEEAHPRRSFPPVRLECPLGCKSFKKRRIELGQPIDELTICLGGFSPYGLKTHLEKYHPDCPDGQLSRVELAQKYRESTPPPIYYPPGPVPATHEYEVDPETQQGTNDDNTNVDNDIEVDVEGSVPTNGDAARLELSADDGLDGEDLVLADDSHTVSSS